MSNPNVFILILNWNGWHDTIECLQSVKQLNYPNYRTIVLDNNSSDESISKIKEWASAEMDCFIEYDKESAVSGGSYKYEKKLMNYQYNNKLVLIHTGDNLGFAGGNNVGIEYALKQKADYVWLLNNDTIVDPLALQEMIIVAEGRKDIGMVGSKLFYYHHPNVIQTLGGSDSITKEGTGHYIHSFEKDCTDFDKDFQINGYICGASLLVKREVIEEIGFLDEKFFMWAEEADWCLRAVKANWKLYYSGKSKVWHKEGASCGNLTTKTFFGRKSDRVSLRRFVIIGYYEVRNHIYFVRKHFKDQFFIFIFYTLFFMTIKILGILIYDKNKLQRVQLLIRGLVDGLSGNMGKQIDPLDYN